MTKRVTARLALVLAVAISHAIASAALPPKYQRLREFEAVLASQTVTGAFPDSEMIQAIEYVSPDRYRVRSAKCRLDVTLRMCRCATGWLARASSR